MNKTFYIITQDIKNNAFDSLALVPTDGTHKLEISPVTQARKLNQNNALWGVAYPPVMESMGLRGEKEREELHEYFCGEYWGWKTYIIMNKKKTKPIRTTTRNEDGKRDVIDKSKMYDFYCFIQQRCAENGILVPDPDPMYGLTR